MGWELQSSSKQGLNRGFSGREQLRLKDQDRWRQGAILLPPIFCGGGVAVAKLDMWLQRIGTVAGSDLDSG